MCGFDGQAHETRPPQGAAGQQQQQQQQQQQLYAVGATDAAGGGGPAPRPRVVLTGGNPVVPQHAPTFSDAMYDSAPLRTMASQQERDQQHAGLSNQLNATDPDSLYEEMANTGGASATGGGSSAGQVVYTSGASVGDGAGYEAMELRAPVTDTYATVDRTGPPRADTTRADATDAADAAYATVDDSFA